MKNKRLLVAMTGAIVFGFVAALATSQRIPSIFANTWAVDRIIDEMEWANGVYTLPRSMNLDETATVKLALSVTSSIDELKNVVRQQEKVEGAKIRVSDYMEAKLSGAGFEITEITPSRQPVSRMEVTEWAWAVKARSAGKQRLNLSLNAIINDASGERARSVRTFEKEVEVSVTFPHRVSTFFLSNWRWLSIILLIPAIALFLKPAILSRLGHSVWSQPSRTRFVAGEPASNYKRVLELIGASRIEAVFDPFLDEKGLDNLLTLIKLGAVADPGMRLITSSKVASKINTRYVTEWLREAARLGELRISSSIKPHRRFILLSGAECLILGLSLNDLGKDEAAHLEKDDLDRPFFEKEWAAAESLPLHGLDQRRKL